MLLAELEAALSPPAEARELEAAADGSSVGRKELSDGTVIFWHVDTVACVTRDKKTQHLSAAASSGGLKRGRVRVDPASARLEELKRKKAMIEKYANADSSEAVRLMELTAKWKEVGQEALADLKRISGVSGKSDWELLSMMQLDPALLDVEKEEESDEEDEEGEENDGDGKDSDNE